MKEAKLDNLIEDINLFRKMYPKNIGTHERFILPPSLGLERPIYHQIERHITRMSYYLKDDEVSIVVTIPFVLPWYEG